MNEPKNRTQFIETLIGLGGTLVIVIALGIYILDETRRIEETRAAVLGVQLDEAMTLYAQNCSVCHGSAGQGLGATPPLDSPALKTAAFEDLVKIIARGRYDTAMPAWSREDGGPLSDYQIEELAVLIQTGDWGATGERVVNLGLAPLVPFTTEPDPAILEQVGALRDGDSLQTAIQVFAANCVACHGADGLGTGMAPALNDPDVRLKSTDDLERVITFGNAGTLMAGWENVLSPAEIDSVVSLIQRWDEIPAGSLPAPDVPLPTTAESLILGSDLYSANCSRCHGPEGQGTPRAPALNVKSFLTDTGDQAIQQIVTLGVPGTAMPAWGDRMADSEIQAVVGFIRQWEATAPEVAQPVRPGGGGPPWLRNQPASSQAQGGADPIQPTASAGGPAVVQPARTIQPNWWAAALAAGVLLISLSMVLRGLSSMKKQ